MEMSLSGSLRKVQISTCFELAEKLLMIPTAKCYVLILCVLKCADGLGMGRKGGGGLGGRGRAPWNRMQTRSDVKYYILASSHAEYLLALFACILQICPRLVMRAALVFRLS